ncbi:hypothetical protein XA68_14440 [Ophiocordyceps unilateralis]|uniref:Uncharacterized protein n=1 Tax=Ophiocordyceps unilateralis TaxID=268505 RepID=A0A2A9P9A0_OPHUN|nr:hypothetical protein XA68_14440 [Ophiocordyceps unilateralis]
MSSLQRTRSQRTISGPSSRQQVLAAEPKSPSRLPVKPPTTGGPRPAGSRPVSAVLEPTTTGPRGATRPVSTVLQRSSSTATKRDSGLLGRSASTSRRVREPTTTTTTTTTTTQPRRIPTHTRAKSTATAGVLGAAPRPNKPRAASTSLGRASPPKQQTQQARARPAFSTLQQHYTPAKKLASKAPTSTFLAPTSPSKLPANVAASTEVHRLQAELLQLHLLHSDAALVDGQWHASAKDKLGRRFAALGRASSAVSDREAAVDRLHNLRLLRRWGDTLDYRLQLLGDVLDGLWTLGGSGGRYRRAVRGFDHWAEGLGRVEAARADAEGALDRHASLFLDELDASWREECAVLTSRLLGWRAQLQQMDDLPADDDDDDARPTSGLQRMLAGARDLLRLMLAELSAMDDIEREARAREVEWVEGMIGKGDDDDDDDDDNDGDGDGDDDDTRRGAAVWRVV